MRLRDLFWNPAQRRLRLPWRLPLQAVLVAVAVLVASTAVLAVAGVTPDGPTTALPPVPRVLGMLAIGGGSAAGIWAGSRLLDRRWFADYGLHLDRRWWLDLGFGLALGAGLLTAVFFVELALGWATVEGTLRVVPDAGTVAEAFLAVVVVFLVVGVYEELLLRGYLLKNLAEGLVFFDPVSARAALGVAALASSVVFGVGHALNPNATVASTLGVTAAGLFLALGYLLTGELGIPVGVHVTWNLFQGPVYGFPVSGADFGVNLVVVEQRGPALLTGGAFGPEAGLLGLAAVLVGSAAIAWWVRHTRGRVALDESLVAPDLRWRD